MNIYEYKNLFDLNTNNSIIISSVDSVTLLGIEIANHLSFEKHVSVIISFAIFLSLQYTLLYIYFYIVNAFKYFLSCSKIKKSYLYYYIKVVRFSIDLLLGSSNLPICCCKIIV